MRSESISPTLSATTSETRSPAPYAVASAALYRVGVKGQTRLTRYPRASRAGFDQHRDPTQHQVWCLQAFARAHERADWGARHRQHALPKQRVAQRLARQAEAAPPVVEGDAFLPDQPAGARNVVVAQVLADAGQLMAHLDAEIAQAFRLADAR
jgi:hypothetical protein